MSASSKPQTGPQYPALQERQAIWQTAWGAMAGIAALVALGVWQQANAPHSTTAIWPVYPLAVLAAASLWLVFTPLTHQWPFRLTKSLGVSPLELVNLGPGSPCVQHTVRRKGTTEEWFVQELPTDPDIEHVATLVRLGIANHSDAAVEGVKLTVRQAVPTIGFLPMLMHVKDDNLPGSPQSHQGITVVPGREPNHFFDVVIRWFPGSGRSTDFFLYGAAPGVNVRLSTTSYQLLLAATGRGVPEFVCTALITADALGAPTLTLESFTTLGTHAPAPAAAPNDEREELIRRVGIVVSGINNLIATHHRYRPDLVEPGSGTSRADWERTVNRNQRHDNETVGRYFEEYNSEVQELVAALSQRDALTEAEVHHVEWITGILGFHNLSEVSAMLAKGAERLREAKPTEN
jgi:hypothetical protein